MIKQKMLKDKRGWLIRDFVAVGILFGLVISMYIIQVASVAQNYGNTEIIDEDFAEHYNNLQTNLNQLDTSYSATQGTGGISLIGSFDVAFNAVFTVISMVWQGILIYTGMASTIPEDFSFIDKATATIFLSGIIALITAYLIFIWLSSVSRGKL